MSQPLSQLELQGQEDLTYGDIVWGQYKKNKLAYLSLWGVGGLFALAIFAPVIASTRPFIWSTAEGMTFPWFTSLFDRNYYENAVDIFFNLWLVFGIPLTVAWWGYVQRMQKSGLQKRPRRRKMIKAMGGCISVFLLTFVFILAKPHAEPYRMFVEEYEAAQEAGEDVKALFPPIRYSARQTGFRPLEKPSKQHVLGVDQSTRDVAVRLLYGTRISLSIGVIAVSIYVTIGIILGATAGFFGGWVDIGIQRLIEVTMCVPSLFVILTLVAFVEEPSIFHIMIIIGLVRWTGVARLTRGEYLRLRSLDFVTAARALGYPRRRIIFQQILPNALGPVLVAAPFGVASAILFEATLSFLGLGDVSAPSWGQTLQEGYASGSWHLILAPGFAIFVTVFLLNVAGEALRDALDPKMRK